MITRKWPDDSRPPTIQIGPGAASDLAADESEPRFKTARFALLHEFARVYQGSKVWGPAAEGDMNRGAGTANGFANRVLRRMNGKKANPKRYARTRFRENFGTPPREITWKSAGPKSDSGTVEPMDEDQVIGAEDFEELSDRVADVEEAVSKITPDAIAKAIAKQQEESGGDGNGDGGSDGGDADKGGDGDGDAGDGNGSGDGDGDQSAEDLAKQRDKLIDDVIEKVNGIDAKIEKLAQGGSSQGADDIEKADAKTKATEIWKAEGFSDEDAAALQGIFN